MSWGLAAAVLLRSNSSSPMTVTAIPFASSVWRAGQASANATPEISVRISMRNGGVPIRKPTPGRARSSSESVPSGAPNARSASMTRVALSGEASTHRSKSLVARGLPWTATACPPTRRYLASARFNSIARSRKSGGNVGVTGESLLLEAEGPGERESISGRQPCPLDESVGLHGGVRVRPVDATRPGRGPRETTSFGVGGHGSRVADGSTERSPLSPARGPASA
jgi:hypothetical protein